MKSKIKLEDEVIIKMDPNSPEWKAKIAKLHEELEKKYDGDIEIDEENKPSKTIVPGYRNRGSQSF